MLIAYLRYCLLVFIRWTFYIILFCPFIIATLIAAGGLLATVVITVVWRWAEKLGKPQVVEE
jgi:hypothetical protein